MRSDRNALVLAQECQDQGAAPGRSLLINGFNSNGLPATFFGLYSSDMDADHRIVDEQSLRLTHAAVDALRKQPSLLNRVTATLDHWDRVAPHDSKPLRDQWRRILSKQEWSLALDTGPDGQQLRQASPLGKALAPAERLAIIRACKGRSSNI